MKEHRWIVWIVTLAIQWLTRKFFRSSNWVSFAHLKFLPIGPPWQRWFKSLNSSKLLPIAKTSYDTYIFIHTHVQHQANCEIILFLALRIIKIYLHGVMGSIDVLSSIGLHPKKYWCSVMVLLTTLLPTLGGCILALIRIGFMENKCEVRSLCSYAFGVVSMRTLSTTRVMWAHVIPRFECQFIEAYTFSCIP